METLRYIMIVKIGYSIDDNIYNLNNVIIVQSSNGNQDEKLYKKINLLVKLKNNINSGDKLEKDNIIKRLNNQIDSLANESSEYSFYSKINFESYAAKALDSIYLNKNDIDLLQEFCVTLKLNKSESKVYSMENYSNKIADIYKTDDDWYYIRVYGYEEYYEVSGFYKCDQFAGLENLINSKFKKQKGIKTKVARTKLATFTKWYSKI